MSRPPSHALLSCLGGLLTGCLSSDSELAEKRSPPPTFVMGRLEGGPRPCLGTLVKRDKVLTLEHCIEDAAATDLSFVVDSEQRRKVLAVSSDPSALTDAPERAERDGPAMLTLSSQLGSSPAWSMDSGQFEHSSVWLNTVLESNSAQRLISCSLGPDIEGPLDCGAVERWPGALAFALENEDPVAVGIDRGQGEPLLSIGSFKAMPDRPTDIALNVKELSGRLTLELSLAVPDWNRIVEGRGAWSVKFETDFSPISLSFFDWEGEPASVVASSDGEVFLQRIRFEALQTPVLVDRVRALSGDDVVLWVLGQEGELCRRVLYPMRLGWRCGASVPGATAFAALRVDATEFVAVSSDHGVKLLSFAADEFGEAVPWGLDLESTSAMTLGRLQSGQPYALAATSDGKVWFRTLDASDTWSSWSQFDAGTLPTPVEALHGGHVPGWPEEIYALAAGRLHYTIESVTPSSEASTGDDPSLAPRFARWH